MATIDVIEIRRMLELQIAELVVVRATQDDLDRIEASSETLRQSRTHADSKIAGYEFRIAILRASRNPLLIAIYELTVDARSRPGWSHFKSVSETDADRAARNRRSRQFIDALINRDMKGAVALARPGSTISCSPRWAPGRSLSA